MSSDSMRYLTLTEEYSGWSDYYIQQAINNATNIEYTYTVDFGDNLVPPAGHQLKRNNTIVLHPSGCQQGDIWNCTAACLDEEQGPSITWSGPNSPYTIQNCLVYPIIATAAAQGWLEEKPPGLLKKYGIFANLSLPIETTNAEVDYHHAWPVIRKCMQKFCLLLHDGDGQRDRCSFGSPALATDYAMGPSSSLWSPKLGIPGNFCTLGPLSLNSDFAGPGVLIAYIQQFAILLGAMILVNLMILPTRIARYVLKRRYRRQSQLPSAGAKQVLKLLRFRKLTASLFTALLDFQKTQIMFALVTQITTIIAVINPSLLAAATPLQMNFAQHYLMLLNTTLVLAVSFGLLLLRKDKGAARPQILLASLCSILLGLGIMLTIMNVLPVDFERHRQDPPETHDTPECAGVNPMQYCQLSKELTGYVSSPRITDLRDEDYPTGFSLSLAEWGFRFALACWAFLMLASMLVSMLVSVALDCSPPERHWTRGLREGYYLIFEILSCWIMYSTISILLAIYSDDAFAAGRSWSIGQILAVMVWAPTLIEWLYLIWG